MFSRLLGGLTPNNASTPTSTLDNLLDNESIISYDIQRLPNTLDIGVTIPNSPNLACVLSTSAQTDMSFITFNVNEPNPFPTIASLLLSEIYSPSAPLEVILIYMSTANALELMNRWPREMPKYLPENAVIDECGSLVGIVKGKGEVELCFSVSTQVPAKPMFQFVGGTKYRMMTRKAYEELQAKRGKDGEGKGTGSS